MFNNAISPLKRGASVSNIVRKRSRTEGDHTSMHSARANFPMLMGGGSSSAPSEKLATSASFSRDPSASAMSLQGPAMMTEYFGVPSSMAVSRVSREQLITVLELLPNAPKENNVKKLGVQRLQVLAESAFKTLKGLLLVKDKLSYRQNIINEQSDLNGLLEICEKEYAIAKPDLQQVNPVLSTNNDIDMKMWLNSLEIDCINKIFLRLGNDNQFVSQDDYGEKIKSVFEEFKQDLRNGYKNDFQLLVEDDSTVLAHKLLRESYFPADQQHRVKIITPQDVRDIIYDHAERGMLTEEMKENCLGVIDVTERLSSPWLRSDFFREILLITTVKTNEASQPILATSLYTDLGLQAFPESIYGKGKGKGKAYEGASATANTNNAYRVPVGARFYGESSLMSLSEGLQNESGQFINPIHYVVNMLERHVLIHRQFDTEDTRNLIESVGEPLIHSAIDFYNENNTDGLNQKIKEIFRFIKQHNIQLLDMDSKALDETGIDKMSLKQKGDFLTSFDKVEHTAGIYPRFLEGQRYLVALPMIKNHMAELMSQKESGEVLTEDQQFILDNFTRFQDILLAKYGLVNIDVTDSLVMDTMESFLQHSGIDTLVRHGVFSKKPHLGNSGAWHFQPEKISISQEDLSVEMARPSWKKEVNESYFTPEAVESYAKSRLHIKKKEKWYNEAGEEVINKVMIAFDELIRSNNVQAIPKGEGSIHSDAEALEPELTWQDKLKPEFKGNLPEEYTFILGEKSVELKRSTIRLMLQTADEAVPSGKSRAYHVKLGAVEKKLRLQQPDDFRVVNGLVSKRQLIKAVICHFAPSITNPGLRQHHSMRPPLPDADFFSGQWQNKLQKPLPENASFTVNNHSITLTKASLACLLSHMDSFSEKVNSTYKVKEAMKALNKYKVSDCWSKFPSENRRTLIKNIAREFAPTISPRLAASRKPLPPLEVLAGEWQSKLSKPLDEELSLEVEGKEITLSRHALFFICWFADQQKHLGIGAFQPRILNTVKELNQYEVDGWGTMVDKTAFFKDKVVFAFLNHVAPAIAQIQKLPVPELQSLSDEWEQHLLTPPLPDTVTHSYGGYDIQLSKHTVSFMLNKVHEASGKAVGGCERKYQYAVNALHQYNFTDWHAVRNKVGKKSSIVGSFVSLLAPGVRRNHTP